MYEYIYTSFKHVLVLLKSKMNKKNLITYFTLIGNQTNLIKLISITI